jgi:phosphoribosylanthranilate isomerase
MLLLDSHCPGDVQIGALGVTHSWEIDRKIVESVRIPVIIAGGLGPDNVIDAIRKVRPAGVDSKTKTDKDDESHTKDFQKVKRFIAAKSP